MTSTVRRFGVLLAAVGVAALGAGCGGDKKLAKVSGVVTLDGKPLDGATVVFHPEGGGRPATGTTGADGHFSLTTYTSGDGAQVGDHKVVVSKSSQANVSAPQPDNPKGMVEAMKEAEAKRKAEAAKPKPAVIPTMYGDLAKTPLKCQVPTDGPVEFSLRSAGGS